MYHTHTNFRGMYILLMSQIQHFRDFIFEDHTLSAKTVKYMSLKNLYKYGICLCVCVVFVCVQCTAVCACIFICAQCVSVCLCVCQSVFMCSVFFTILLFINTAHVQSDSLFNTDGRLNPSITILGKY